MLFDELAQRGLLMAVVPFHGFFDLLFRASLLLVPKPFHDGRFQSQHFFTLFRFAHGDHPRLGIKPKGRFIEVNPIALLAGDGPVALGTLHD